MTFRTHENGHFLVGTWLTGTNHFCCWHEVGGKVSVEEETVQSFRKIEKFEVVA